MPGKPGTGAMQPERLLESIYNGIVAIDAAAEIIFFNQTAARIFHIPSAEALGRPVLEALPNTGGKLVEVLRSGQAVHGHKLTGKKVTLISNISPILEGDQVTGAISVFEEMAEIEKIAGELDAYRRINRQLDAVFESSYDGLFITDGDGNILRCNQGSERLIGHRERDIVGRNVRDLVTQGFIDTSVTLEVLKKKTSLTILQKLRNGKTIIVTGTPVYNEDGTIELVVTNERDITALNRMKLQLRKYQALAGSQGEAGAQGGGDPVLGKDVIAVSRATRQAFETARIAARFDTTILLQGETGVGKDLVARFIHQSSGRRDGPFIAINCGAIPPSLIESELFGYRKGAFTGADTAGKPGLFQLADGGTLFLDEIGEVPFNVQVKFLKAIEEKTIFAIGDNQARQVNVRIIAATNRDLEEMVSQGTFREDLFFRLNVVPVKIPPLRERKEDIFYLITRLLQRLNEKFGCQKAVSPEAMDLLLDYPYPGNIRELENIIERIMVLCPEAEIQPRHLPANVQQTDAFLGNTEALPDAMPLKEALAAFEKRLIQSAVRKHGSMAAAARALGVNPSTILRKQKRYDRHSTSAIVHD